MSGIEQLWFLTIIMIDYVLLIVIKKFEHTQILKNNSRNAYKGYLVTLIILDCILAYWGIQLAYMLTFFVGYVLGKSKINITKTNYLLLSFNMICSMVIRLVLKYIMDGTKLYDNIVVQITHIVLAVWILITVFIIYRKKTDFCNRLCENKIWGKLEEHSMMIYMTHCMFLVGDLNIANLNVGIGIKLIVFVLCTGICSVLLKKVSQKAIVFITKGFCKREKNL